MNCGYRLPEDLVSAESSCRKLYPDVCVHFCFRCVLEKLHSCYAAGSAQAKRLFVDIVRLEYQVWVFRSGARCYAILRPGTAVPSVL